MAPKLLDDHIRFRFAGADDVVSVALDCDSAIAGSRHFMRAGDGWELALPRPPLDRFEYRFTVTRDGLDGSTTETVLDPDNPVTVETAFGSRSVMELPGYAAPSWLSATGVPGVVTDLALEGETADDVPVTLWSPEGTDGAALPLLFVHDGPEYATLASLTQYSAAMIAAGSLPPHRLALAHPVLRDAWYSGSPQYLRTIAGQGISRIAEVAPVDGPVVVMGASLGGLTALLVGLLDVDEIGGVFSQSGSFFQTRLDGQESDFPWFGRISRRVQEVLDTRETARPLRIGMTCGALEENAANNRDMAAALQRAGHTVTYTEVADLHNYTAWRDALDPHLTEVLRDVWGNRQG
ncbi:enterochelin esterase family protein [Knoellia remsis]|uniref:Enterochelin esterase family protein n=1 Tax=Knoellia remsis TaxID=407159 RepID=A0A2T0UY77_9MICO|nr:alpha/beta hydrolase-fold protein [Knoellia remsis]PRY62872.1 enterochelin esterase family protein [Knoellia remsis]